MKNQTYVLWILVLLFVTIILLACDITISLGGQATAVADAATSTLPQASPTPIVLVVTATLPPSTSTSTPPPSTSTPTALPSPSSTPTKTATPKPPTATPIPTAEAITLGNILFQDTLAGNSNKWSESTREENFFFQDGKSHITLLTTNASGYTKSEVYNNPGQRPRIRDFVLEVEAALAEGSDANSYGVSFRQTDEAFYFFETSGNGSFRFRKSEDKWTTLIDWTPHPAILTGKRSNALRVVAKGNAFTFYVNGTKVGSFSDSSFPDGTFGIVVSNTGAGGMAHAAFDNLTVWNLGTPPSATAKEEFTKGEIFFQDDFSTNKSGWKEGPVQFKYFFEGGKYNLSVRKAEWLVWAYPVQEPRFKDFVLEVEVTPLEGPETTEQGVLFRRTANNYYYFEVYGDGTFIFEKFNKGIWTTLIPKTPNAVIQTGKRPNILKVAAKGTSFSFFINGTKVGAYSDDSFPEGTIALGVGSDKQGLAHAAFANLKVWELLTK
jgi:hypothetical protein